MSNSNRQPGDRANAAVKLASVVIATLALGALAAAGPPWGGGPQQTVPTAPPQPTEPGEAEEQSPTATAMILPSPTDSPTPTPSLTATASPTLLSPTAEAPAPTTTPAPTRPPADLANTEAAPTTGAQGEEGSGLPAGAWVWYGAGGALLLGAGIWAARRRRGRAS